MRAMVITEPGGPEVLKMKEIEAPTPGPGEILVSVKASAVNRADMLQRMGLYAAPSWVRADVPGLEYAGQVEALGAGVTDWAVGDRVMGIVGGASCAEKLTVHAREVLPVPSNLDWAQAAAIPEAFLTAYDAIWLQAGLRMGETALIHAVGSGVGTAAVQMARLCGARVLGTSRTPEKLERCQALGLDEGVLAVDGDFLGNLEAVAPEGVHVIADFIGGAYLEQNLKALRAQGRMIVIGLMGGREAQFPMGLLLRKRLRVMGTVLRARHIEEKISLAQDFGQRVVPHFESGRLKPVVDKVFPMEELADAHRYMASNGNFGKIVVAW
jgi:putative PIG3 family NAD(P)H quinone oxidoreductase